MSLGNVLSAAAPKEAVPFIRDEDQDVFDRRKDDAFEVQVRNPFSFSFLSFWQQRMGDKC